jgi:ubiquinone/menaquinone biosynthesis C-methylase UbiE
LVGWNIPVNMKQEEKDRILFDSIAGKYIKKDKFSSSIIPRKTLLLNAISPWLKQPKSLGILLDIGCGVGAAAEYLKGYYRKYIGIDQSSQMVDAARIFNRGNPDAQFIAGNIKTFECPDRSFDMVLSIGALHHMTDLDSVIKTLCRLSKSGGIILVIEPHSANPAIQLLRSVRGRLDRTYSRDQIFFSENELITLFEKNNISKISCEYMGYFSTPFAEIVFHPQFLFTPLSKMASTIDSWLYRHLPRSLGKLGFKIVLSGQVS